VEGSLKTEKWEDPDGHKKQITKVIGSKLIMLGERKKPVLSEVERKEGREPRDEGDAPF
jgi:single-stranded DNA-binding protein